MTPIPMMLPMAPDSSQEAGEGANRAAAPFAIPGTGRGGRTVYVDRWNMERVGAALRGDLA
ncbi:MAG: hypothetical protein ACHQ2E_03160 [Gemmatimonadales bacterium]